MNTAGEGRLEHDALYERLKPLGGVLFGEPLSQGLDGQTAEVSRQAVVGAHGGRFSAQRLDLAAAVGDEREEGRRIVRQGELARSRLLAFELSDTLLDDLRWIRAARAPGRLQQLSQVEIRAPVRIELREHGAIDEVGAHESAAHAAN